MTPTNELRFVEREIAYSGKYEQVLQQKWVETYYLRDESGNDFRPEEWCDVPLVKEVQS